MEEVRGIWQGFLRAPKLWFREQELGQVIVRLWERAVVDWKEVSVSSSSVLLIGLRPLYMPRRWWFSSSCCMRLHQNSSLWPGSSAPTSHKTGCHLQCLPLIKHITQCDWVLIGSCPLKLSNQNSHFWRSFTNSSYKPHFINIHKTSLLELSFKITVNFFETLANSFSLRNSSRKLKSKYVVKELEKSYNQGRLGQKEFKSSTIWKTSVCPSICFVSFYNSGRKRLGTKMSLF